MCENRNGNEKEMRFPSQRAREIILGRRENDVIANGARKGRESRARAGESNRSAERRTRGGAVVKEAEEEEKEKEEVTRK